VVTLAATGEKDGNFDTVVARHIDVINETGDRIIALGNSDGDGLVKTYSSNGKDLVTLTSTAKTSISSSDTRSSRPFGSQVTGIIALPEPIFDKCHYISVPFAKYLP
jgi:hypothetical protein